MRNWCKWGIGGVIAVLIAVIAVVITANEESVQMRTG